MNQAAVLDWLGIDVWRLRVPSPVPTASPPAIATSAVETIVPPSAQRDRPADAEPAHLPVSGPGPLPLAVSVSPVSPANTVPPLTLMLCVPSGAAKPALLTRIAQSAPRSVTVCSESMDTIDESMIHWQGRDWLLRDLRQDPGLKRRLWRALCLPASSAE